MLTLPILMYHKIHEIPSEAGYRRNYVLPAQFEEQMKSLEEWGYTTVTIERWMEIRAGREPAPKRPIALTFDDGYESVYRNAWPALRRHGMTATIFLVAHALGKSNQWDRGEPQQPLMTLDEIKEMSAAGIAFGSHTCTHRALPELSEKEQLDELAGSREELEAALGQPVTTLAYPYNKQNRKIRRLVRRAGYRAAVLGRGRLNARWTNPYALMRIAIHLQTTREEFERQLARPRWALGL